MEITRDEIRKLATRLHIEAHGRDPDALVSITARDAKTAADLFCCPDWFSAHELRLAADAMDILNYATADGWTLRRRLDAFWKSGPIVKNAGSFAAYLKMLPNGGIQ